MAALHQYGATPEKIHITPGSYIALWAPAFADWMTEPKQNVFGGATPYPTREVFAPVLLYTPDGQTLQDRNTGKPLGTLTQYPCAHNYLWEYTTYTKPHHCTYILRVWIIDPMPEAAALAVTRAAYNAETAEKRFADFCDGWGVRKLDEMSAGTGEESEPCFSEGLRVVFENTHQHQVYGSDHGAAIRAFEEAADVAVKALEGRLSEELDKASKALETVPPMGDPSYNLTLGAYLPWRAAVSNVIDAEAPTLRRYVARRIEGTAVQELQKGYSRALSAVKEAAGSAADHAGYCLAPAPAIR